MGFFLRLAIYILQSGEVLEGIPLLMTAGVEIHSRAYLESWPHLRESEWVREWVSERMLSLFEPWLCLNLISQRSSFKLLSLSISFMWALWPACHVYLLQGLVCNTVCVRLVLYFDVRLWGSKCGQCSASFSPLYTLLACYGTAVACALFSNVVICH